MIYDSGALKTLKKAQVIQQKKTGRGSLNGYKKREHLFNRHLFLSLEDVVSYGA